MSSGHTTNKIRGLNKSKINRQSHSGKSLFKYVQDNNVGVVKYLLEQGHNPNKHITYETKNKNNCIVKIQNFPLLQAAVNNSVEIVELLLKNGADVNKMDSLCNGTALSESVERGHYQIVKLLLQHGAKCNIKQGKHGSVFYSAVKKSHVDILDIMLKHGADPYLVDYDNKNVLELAVSRSDENIAEFLLKNGVIPNTKNNNGETPLFHAICNKNMSKLLVKYGADINATDKFGQNVLLKSLNYYSSLPSTHSYVKWLLKNGIDPNVGDNHNNYPILCLFHEYPKIRKKLIKLLIKYKVDVNIIGTYNHHSKNSPLGIAVAKSDVKIVKLLLLNGADPNKACFTDLCIQYCPNEHSIIMACEGGTRDKKIFKLLLIHGISLTGYKIHDKPLLIHLAFHEENYKIRKILKYRFKQGYRYDQSFNGRNLLDIAMDCENLKLKNLYDKYDKKHKKMINFVINLHNNDTNSWLYKDFFCDDVFNAMILKL